MRLHALVPAYGRPDLLRRCLASLADQDDDWYSVTVGDDATPKDGLDPQRDEWADKAPQTPEPWRWVKRPGNVGALLNIAHLIGDHSEMEPDDVIVLVDGDDWLPHPSVLSQIRAAYSADIELTYGSYVSQPFDASAPPARQIPREILESGSIRAFTLAHGAWFNHPLTFRRRLFDQLAEADFLDDDGEPIRKSYDMALMCPLLELAGVRAKFLAHTLYCYGSDRPDSVSRDCPDLVHAETLSVLSRGRQHLAAHYG